MRLDYNKIYFICENITPFTKKITFKILKLWYLGSRVMKKNKKQIGYKKVIIIKSSTPCLYFLF